MLLFLSLELRFLVAPQIIYDTEVDQYQHGLTDAALLLEIIGSAEFSRFPMYLTALSRRA